MLLAAHCFVSQRFRDVPKGSGFKVHMGKYYLNDSEPESVSYDVDLIVPHDDFGEDSRYHVDIAIVILLSPVDLTENIDIVCLPSSTKTKDVLNVTGTVVGWDMDGEEQNASEKKLQELVMPVIPQGECFLIEPTLAKYSSNQMFCAGYQNMSKGLCPGDSGGGFYRKNDADERWIVLGIVSGSLETEDAGECNVNGFAIFTNVLEHMEWIRKVTGITDWNQ